MLRVSSLISSAQSPHKVGAVVPLAAILLVKKPRPREASLLSKVTVTPWWSRDLHPSTCID